MPFAPATADDLSLSLLDSLGHALQTMGWVQLGCAMAAAIAYALVLNASFTTRARLAAAAVAFVAAATFSALTPSWASGVLLMMLAVAGIGAFATAVWLLTRLVGLRDAPAGALVAPAAALPLDTRLPPVSAFGRETSPHPF